MRPNLQIALEGFAHALTHGGRYDLRAMLRFVQLWLAHSDDASVNSSVSEWLKVQYVILHLLCPRLQPCAVLCGLAERANAPRSSWPAHWWRLNRYVKAIDLFALTI